MTYGTSCSQTNLAPLFSCRQEVKKDNYESQWCKLHDLHSKKDVLYFLQLWKLWKKTFVHFINNWKSLLIIAINGTHCFHLDTVFHC